MFVLFALITAFIVYVLAALVLRRSGSRSGTLSRMSVVTWVAFLALLIVFVRLSSTIGIDLGPGHPVSYSIPEDYLARGLTGIAVLLVYALAMLAPALGLGVALQRRR